MPAAGLLPLRVGPEDVEGSEAGDLVKDLGVHNQAKELLQAVARTVPVELRIAMQRYEHKARSKALDADELYAQCAATIGEENFEQVLGGRVRGPKNNPLQSMVIIQYETASGRTGRCAVNYNEHTFGASIDAYDQQLREGKIELPKELSDPVGLREANDTLSEELARVSQELEAERAGEGGGEQVGVDEALAEAGGDGAPPALREADEVVLPDGVQPGDPGYPVGEDGEPIALPQSVRDELIAAHERDQAAAAQAAATEEELAKLRAEAEQPGTEVPAAQGTTWPEDLGEVELPEGNADEIKAAMPFYSTVVVAAIAERDTRSTVQAAAAAELETRPDKPAEPATDGN